MNKKITNIIEDSYFDIESYNFNTISIGGEDKVHLSIIKKSSDCIEYSLSLSPQLSADKYKEWKQVYKPFLRKLKNNDTTNVRVLKSLDKDTSKTLYHLVVLVSQDEINKDNEYIKEFEEVSQLKGVKYERRTKELKRLMFRYESFVNKFEDEDLYYINVKTSSDIDFEYNIFNVEEQFRDTSSYSDYMMYDNMGADKIDISIGDIMEMYEGMEEDIDSSNYKLF